MISKELNGCIQFIDDTEGRKFSHWINLSSYSNRGCSANVGYLGNHASYKNRGQWLNLSPYGCLTPAIINHEMLHALGFSHEQERPDRDRYVKVWFDRIQSDKKHNFDMIKARV